MGNTGCLQIAREIPPVNGLQALYLGNTGCKCPVALFTGAVFVIPAEYLRNLARKQEVFATMHSLAMDFYPIIKKSMVWHVNGMLWIVGVLLMHFQTLEAVDGVNAMGIWSRQ